jgi:hypothetical protein
VAARIVGDDGQPIGALTLRRAACNATRTMATHSDGTAISMRSRPLGSAQKTAPSPFPSHPIRLYLRLPIAVPIGALSAPFAAHLWVMVFRMSDAELLRVDSLLGKRRFGGEIELVYVAGESHHSRDACGEATESTAHALLMHLRDVASAVQLGQRLDGFSGPDLSRVPRSTPIAGSPRPSARRLPSTVHHDGLMAYDVD